MMAFKKRKNTHVSLHGILRKTNFLIEDIRAFLDRDKSSINKVDRNGRTPLLVVLGKENCSVDIVKILLEYGADVNCKDIFGRSSLLYAIERRREEALIRALLEAPDFSSINEADHLENTPLIVSIINNYSINVVKMLLHYGANVNCKNQNTHSPLFFALEQNNEALIRALLEAPDFSSINEVDEFNKTPLLFAIEKRCSVSIIRILLKHGANVNCKDTFGRSPLSYALEYRNDEAITRALLEAPGFFTINKVDQLSSYSLLSAIRNNCSANILKLLLNYGVDISFRSNFGSSLLMEALHHNCDEAVVKILLEVLDASSVNDLDPFLRIPPLLFALHNINCSTNIIKLLLQYGADVNYRNRYGHSPLIYALQYRSDEAIIRALLEAPGFSSINLMDRFKVTPLLFAIVYNNSTNIIKLLLQYGADVNLKNMYGSSFLMIALKSNCDETAIKILLEALDANIVNEIDPILQVPPLLFALHNINCSTNIIKLLLQYGADVNYRDRCGESPLLFALKYRRDEAIVRALLEAPGFSSINSMDKFKVTPLLFAVYYNNSSNIIKLLLQYGADVNYKDMYGSSLLMLALNGGCDETTIKILLEALDANIVNEIDPILQVPPLLYAVRITSRSANIIKLLLQYGADVNYRDRHGHSPLLFALQYSRDEAIVRALLEAPGFSSINVVDDLNQPPLLLAIRKNCPSSIVKLLLQYGADIGCRNANGSSILISALESKCDETVVKVLLETLDVTAINEIDPKYRHPPLFCILRQKSCTANVVKLLLQFGADVNYFSFGDWTTVLDVALYYSRGEATIKLLVKYSYLKIKNFDIRPWLKKNKQYHGIPNFAVDCALEVQEMESVEVSRGRTLKEIANKISSTQLDVVNDNDELNILNLLLKMKIHIACPIYFDIILVKVGKQVMITKLQELVLDLATNCNSLSGLGKVLLIYECAHKVAQLLSEEELYRLILTFYTTHN